MLPDVKSEWVRRLRSGEYPQGKDYLNNGNGNFCCLGVRCEMAVEYELLERVTNDDGFVGYQAPDGDCEFFMAPHVLKAMDGARGQLYTLDLYDRSNFIISLAALNDAGFSFDQIADVIEWYY